MTFFQPTDLPGSCNTVEKVRVWTGVVLSTLYPNLTLVENTDRAERQIQDNYYYLTALGTPQWANIQRSTILLDPNWKKGTGKIWTYAKDIGTASVPDEFKS